MASAVELILKERLGREDWTLLFKNRNEVDYGKFILGDFKSLDVGTAIERLKDKCDIDLEKHRRNLDDLKNIRNQIQHLKFSVDKDTVTIILLKTWSFLWDFIHDHLDYMEDEQWEILDRIIKRMNKYKGFIRKRLKEIEPMLKQKRNDGAIVITCPSCESITSKKETLIIPGDEDPECLFCRYKDFPEEVADFWATVFIGYPHSDPKERDIEPVIKECSFCGNQTMIEFDDWDTTPPDPVWFCFSCGDRGSAKMKCHSCGEDFPWEHYEQFYCPSCRGEDSIEEL